jgi:hypothetical protein
MLKRKTLAKLFSYYVTETVELKATHTYTSISSRWFFQ